MRLPIHSARPKHMQTAIESTPSTGALNAVRAAAAGGVQTSIREFLAFKSRGG